MSRSIERQLQQIEEAIGRREQKAAPPYNRQAEANWAAHLERREKYLADVGTLVDEMPAPYRSTVLAELASLGFEKITNFMSMGGGG